jgi:hypothetical protein
MFLWSGLYNQYTVSKRYIAMMVRVQVLGDEGGVVGEGEEGVVGEGEEGVVGEGEEGVVGEGEEGVVGEGEEGVVGEGEEVRRNLESSSLGTF